MIYMGLICQKKTGQLPITIVTLPLCDEMQDQQNPEAGTALSTRPRLIVGYKFINNDDGCVIWHETYSSECSSSVFNGVTRLNEARAGSIRENLSSFIEGKSKWYS